jgi:hypothetical protein
MPAGDYSPNTLQRERVQVRLEEFDIEVQSRLDGMKAEVTQLVQSLKKTFRVELIKIPKAVRTMSLKQFKEKYGCDIGAVQKEAANQQLADVVNMQPPPPPSTTRRSKRALNTSNPGGSSMKRAKADSFTAPTPRTSSRKGRGSKTQPANDTKSAPTSRRTTRASSIRSVNNDEPPVEAPLTERRSTRGASIMQKEVPSTARKARALKDRNGGESFKTPMPAKKGGSKVIIAATPAFDPRLPCTPATAMMRAPKRGESFMSMNGSPIAMGGPIGAKMAMSRSSIITVPLDGGKFVRLDTAADIADFGSIKANLSKKSKKEAVDKLQQLMDQIAGCMDALQ